MEWLYGISDTDASKPGQCIMQGDGNLVIFDGNMKAIWDSATS